MFVEIIPVGGIGRVQPIRLEASQVVIRDSLGNAICVAMLYGADRSIAIAKADDHDFHNVLQNAGIREDVVVETLQLPPPPRGAILVSSPPKG